MRQLVQLQKDLAEIKAAGVQVVGISYDSVEILQKFSDKNKVSFPLLSDADSKVIEAFGVRNERARKGSREEGVPHPCTIIVGTDGKIAAKIPGTVTRRHNLQALLDAAK